MLNHKSLLRILKYMAVVLCLSTPLWDRAEAADYFNCPREPTINANPGNNVLFCDSFENGTFVQNTQCPSAVNDGWCTANVDSHPNAVCSAGAGPAGNNCYIFSNTTSMSDGGGGVVATHGWNGNPSLSGYRERFYIKFMPGYVFNNNHKFLSGQRAAHWTGIDHFGMRISSASGNFGDSTGHFDICPIYGCNILNEYLSHNQGNDIEFIAGRWYYVEFRYVLNTLNVANGIWQQWVNDCGTTGVCTGTPTLRASHSNVHYRNTATGQYNGDFGAHYLDIWGNPADGGQLRLSNWVVVKDAYGLIGFAGSTTPPPDTTPPAPPTGISIVKVTE